jgi:uncharacterized protein (DUF3820 family)
VRRSGFIEAFLSLIINKMTPKTINSRRMPFGKYEGQKVITLDTGYLVHCLGNFAMPKPLEKTMKIIVIWRLSLDNIFDEYSNSNLTPFKKLKL